MANGKLWILTSPKCDHCMSFKNNHMGSFKAFLDKHHVNYENVDLPTVASYPSGTKYPSVLNAESKVSWKPEFIWVPAGTESSAGSAKVFNGQLSQSGRWIMRSSIRDPTTQNLIHWFDEIGVVKMVDSNMMGSSLIPTRRQYAN